MKKLFTTLLITVAACVLLTGCNKEVKENNGNATKLHNASETENQFPDKYMSSDTIEESELVLLKDYIYHVEEKEIIELFGVSTPVDINNFDEKLLYFWNPNGSNAMNLYNQKVNKIPIGEDKKKLLADILKLYDDTVKDAEYIEKYGAIDSITLTASPEESYSMYSTMEIEIIFPNDKNNFTSNQYSISISSYGEIEKVLGIDDSNISVYNRTNGKYDLVDAILEKLGEPTAVYTDNDMSLDDMYTVAQSEGMGIESYQYVLFYDKGDFVIWIPMYLVTRIDKDGTGFISASDMDTSLYYYTKEYWNFIKEQDDMQWFFAITDNTVNY